MRTFPRFSRFFSLALVAVLALSLSACRSSNETMDDDGMMADDEEMAPQVTTRGTINALEQGLTSMSLRAAAANVNGWQERLRQADAAAFSDLIRDLDTLEEGLESGSVDASETAQLLNDLGRQTMDASSMASGRAQENVRMLGETLITASRTLRR